MAGGSGQSPRNPIDEGAKPDAVAMFAPWAGPEERTLRRRIHRAHDGALARATRSRHIRARALLWIAADMARERVFARIGTDDLRETINHLARIFIVADWIEAKEQPDER